MRRILNGDGEDPRSILVVLPTWVGDFVMATPTLRAIRSRFPLAQITFLMESNLRDLVAGGDWMDTVVEWPESHRRRPWHREHRRVAATLRGRRLDWAILLSNTARSAIMAFMARAKHRIGYDREGRRWLLTSPLPVKNRKNRRFEPLPLVEYYADLAEMIGCDRPDDRLELFTTKACDRSVAARLSAEGVASRRPLVVISPGAKYGSAKCWMPERFAATADRLIAQRDAAVCITCGPGEEPIARAIESSMERRAVVMLDPPLTLGELKSLVKRSDLMVCNDAGPRHLAKAFGVPAVTVFGPTHPEWTATSHHNERIVRIDVDCGPCQQRVCPLGHLKCMEGVSVDAVFAAASELLAGQTSASA